jgi:hypothetical protein
MNLIEVFENMPKQDVKTFNKIFKSTPIEVGNNPEVEILELNAADERRIKVGNEFIKLCLKQRNVNVKRVIKNYKIVSFKSKACSKCKIIKEFSEFSPHRTSKGGVRSACKKCCVKQVNKWKQNNKNKLTQVSK